MGRGVSRSVSQYSAHGAHQTFAPRAAWRAWADILPIGAAVRDGPLVAPSAGTAQESP
ncbi:DUF3649 domain-containing protein [Croceicoccus sp. YJ47]|uniref:DUF3649 domain-containing protein n=1 Tax=Croceicoccus sp. YJ47 TaxID=2798724 RepID=UPI0035300155